VAATNRTLEDAVMAGGFRRDLYFRLKVVEILVPPLRRRPEDVEPLARHFLDRFSAETGRAIRGFTPEALEAMRTYHWPGNIRELRNVVERAVVLAQDEWLDVADVSLSHLASAGDTDRGAPRPAAFVPTSIEEMERRHVLATLEAVGGNKTKAAAILGTGPLVPTTIEEMERRHVLATLEAVGGNKTKAAAILGIERSTLDRKLAKWAKV
ncbi:MAG: helix-turn-helix domain-containing protein, partial [Planctomycetota bacterium]